jgi:hypothetical protein
MNHCQSRIRPVKWLNSGTFLKHRLASSGAFHNNQGPLWQKFYGKMNLVGMGFTIFNFWVPLPNYEKEWLGKKIESDSIVIFLNLYACLTGSAG